MAGKKRYHENENFRINDFFLSLILFQQAIHNEYTATTFLDYMSDVCIWR